MFPVKYGKVLLDKEVAEIIRETAIGTEERCEIEIEAIGIYGDHIHLLCGAHPKISAGRVVQIFKGITAREVFRRKLSMKKELWGGKFWTDEYYITTVGERANWAVVEKYVSSQEKPKAELVQLKLF